MSPFLFLPYGLYRFMFGTMRGRTPPCLTRVDYLIRRLPTTVTRYTQRYRAADHNLAG